ncbi:MAG: hypothetical protein OXC95_02985 [Dehalococcoidia bacterium]|nr:hypothetical protein [Dehalococcoidia bacterium]
MFCDPRYELALAIHRKTDNGNDIVDFLKDVLGRNIPDVRLDHQIQAARMLTKHGHFPDADLFIQRHAGKRSPRKSRRESTAPRRRMMAGRNRQPKTPKQTTWLWLRR